MTTTRLPQSADFTVRWDEIRTFDFFEDEHANHLWAFGSIDAEEFARQVNEYDELCDPDYDDRTSYTAADVRYCPAVVVMNDDYPFTDDWLVRIVPEGTVSGLVAVIDR